MCAVALLINNTIQYNTEQYSTMQYNMLVSIVVVLVLAVVNASCGFSIWSSVVISEAHLNNI
jgi:hypothetical protein